MRTEKIYELLMEYVKTLPEEDRAVINHAVERHGYGVWSEPGTTLGQAIVGLKEKIAEESARGAGNTSVLRAMKRIIGESQNCNYAGAWIGKNGRQYVCSGYHGVAVDHHFDLPKVDGNESVEKTMQAEPDNTWIDLPMPSVATLRTHIKLSRAEWLADGKPDRFRAVWDFGEGRPYVNAQYLLDVLECLPDAVAYVKPGMFYPVFFHNKNGIGVLLPIRPPVDSKREATAHRYKAK